MATSQTAGFTDTFAKLRGKRSMSFQVPLDDWQLLHRSAALKGVNAAELVRELLKPGLQKLRESPPTRDDDE